MIKITIVIPNLNGAAFLQDCLQALEKQERGTPEFEVVVVDNGSEDESLALLHNNFPQVKVIELPENTGFCHAVNVGIQSSAAPYVILLNNDTKAAPGFVSALYRAIEKKPDAFSVSACMLMWDNPGLVDDAGDRYCALGWAYARGKGKSARLYKRPAEVFSACGGAAIYRRDVFEKIGLFDELHFAYLEDLDIGWRARLYGYHNYYEPSARVLHYGSASTGSRYNTKKTVLASANSVYVVGKNMPFLQLVWNLPILIPGFLIKYFFFLRKKMGKYYLSGLASGLGKIFSVRGRRQKIPFSLERMGNYMAVQGQLYLNLLRFLKKT